MTIIYQFEYILLGDSKVGKTCIKAQLLDKKLQDKIDIWTLKSIGDLCINFSIKDTVGMESFKTTIRLDFQQRSCGLLVYDITKQAIAQDAYWISIENKFLFVTVCVELFFKGYIKQYSGNSEITLILVGNKCEEHKNREVSYEEGARFAKENNLMFIELSAKTGYNLEEAIKLTAKMIFDKINIGLIDISDEAFGVSILEGASSVAIQLRNNNLRAGKNRAFCGSS